jgi:hypothetical protein
MRRFLQFKKRLKDESGVTAILVALLLTMFIGFSAMAVDVGHIMVTRNELQNIADSTSLAAARWIGDQYEGMTYEQQLVWACDPAAIQTVVFDVANKSFAGGMQGITITADDIKIGNWDLSTTPRLTETLTSPDAVSVTARRDGGANGPITTFFARIFGLDTVDITADATAALTGESTAGDGDLELPVGISMKWFERPDFCNQSIKFYPTGTLDGCAGWMTFDDHPASANRLRKIIDGMEAGTFESPGAIAGETQFEFIGGNVANQLCNIKDLYDQKKDADGNWQTHPNTNITIVGFVTTVVHNVLCPPDGAEITASVICDNTEPGRGGGGNYGTKGSIPGLVE